jgi:hypothetical protein
MSAHSSAREWMFVWALLATGCQAIWGIRPLAEGGQGGQGGQGAEGQGGGAGGCFDCGGTCVDLSTDQEHCGACNRSCNTGACTEGVCKLGVYAQGLEKGYDLAIDGTTVYYTDISAGVVGRVTTDGQLEPLYTGEVSPTLLEASGDTLVFVASGEVKAGPAQGGTTTTLLSGIGNDKAMAASGTTIALASDTGVQLFTPGAWASQLDGGASFSGVGVGASHIFWSETALGEIRYAELSGIVLGPLYTGRPSPLAVAAWDKLVFWSEGPVVMRGDVSLSAAQEIATSPSSITSITADDKGVYWTDASSVRGIYHGSTQPFVISPQATSPSGVVTDATRVLWIESSVIMFAPK